MTGQMPVLTSSDDAWQRVHLLPELRSRPQAVREKIEETVGYRVRGTR